MRKEELENIYGEGKGKVVLRRQFKADEDFSWACYL
jgi:hypothetical protein